MPVNDKIKMFCESLLESRSLDLPRVAELVGLNYFKDIKPRLESSDDDRQHLIETVERLRYKILDSILIVGLEGKEKFGQSPDLSALKLMLALLDNGAVVSEVRREEKVTDKKKKAPAMGALEDVLDALKD